MRVWNKITGLAFHVSSNVLVELVSDYDRVISRIEEDRNMLVKMIPVDRWTKGVRQAYRVWYEASEALDEARKTYDEASEIYGKELGALSKANEVRYKAREVLDIAILSDIGVFINLHEELCPNCTWS